MRKISLIILIAVSNFCTGQTLIVGVLRFNDVHLGGDSQVKITDDLTNEFHYVYDCKILQINNIAVGGAGKRVPEILQVASIVFTKSANFIEGVDSFIQKSKVILKKILEIKRTSNKSAFIKDYKDSLVSAFILCTYEKNIPKMVQIQYFTTTNPDKEIEITEAVKFILLKDKNDCATIGIGIHNTLQESIFKVIGESVPVRIEYFMERQHENTPTIVGGKTSIVKINSDGFSWIEKGVCL